LDDFCSMPFVKVIKNKAYFKRFQVKYRRRREGKTDYRARKRLVTQEKNKYNSPKYRFVARLTNTDIICQVIYAKITGDHVLAAAYSHELSNYGLPVGHTNYPAAYATGLLCARRLLEKQGIAKEFDGEVQVTGKLVNTPVNSTEGRRPFKCLLDVGLARTTTGAKVFACMKGAVDGGIFIPHNEKRFVGFRDGEFKPDALRSRILGGHVSTYMKSLEKDNKEAYNKLYSTYIKAGITAAKLEGTIKACHAAIRKNPTKKPNPKPAPAKREFKREGRLNVKQRHGRSKAKLAYIIYKKSQVAEA